MKSYRKPVAMLLLLLIHLLMLQIDDAVAERNATNVSNARNDSGKIILEEVIISGSGNNTRIIANAVEENPSEAGNDLFALLTNNQIRERRSEQASLNLDQDAAQSRTTFVNGDDEDEVERMKRVIAKYEPQRIISRKTKRKIVENPNGAHDVRGKTTESTTDLEKTYHEVLRNISRKAPELMVYNANQALNPYLSQVTNNLKQIYITDEAIRPAIDNGLTRESRFDVDTSYAAPTLKSKKAKKLLKKHLQLNRTAVLAESGHNIVPRPFSISQSSDSPVITNIQVAQRKPSSTPAGFKHQHIARSSANVLPLVLPTDLFNPLPARRYVPIKRSNRLNLDGNSVTIVSTEASVPISLAGGKAIFSDYVTAYADVIGTTGNPLVAINGHPSFESSEAPATTYVPIQTSASYTLQRQKNPYAVYKNEFVPKIATYNSPDDEKSNLAKLELALFKKFANLYLPNQPNVLNEPKAITQDYQNFSQPVQPSQQVSTSSYVTLKPVSPTLLKAEPIAPVKPAFSPYYDSRLLVSQNLNRKNLTDDKDNEESVDSNEQSRIENADETEKEIADKNIIGNHKIQINHGAYKIHKTPEQREEKDRNEEEKNDRYQQRGHNYGYQNRYQEDDKSNKNDDKHKKYENSRHENNEDEEDVDETQKDEYVSAGENEDEPNYDHHQYNKSEYDQDDPEEQQHEKQRYDHKKYDEQNDHRNKHNHEIEVKQKFVSNNKYPYEYDEKYVERHDKKEDQQVRRHKDREDESVAEDKLVTQRSKDQRARRQRKKQEKKRNNNNDTTHKRKYYRNKDSPRRDSHHEEHEREEYSETNPKHVRKQYHHQQLNGDHNNDNEEVRDHVHGETQEHAHKHEEHHEKKKHGGNHKFEEGEGAEHEEEHHGHEGDKGKKSYKVWHEHEKAKKGHHDKEHASKEYDEKDGKEKKHEEEGGYHEKHNHGDAGKKTAEFGEKGEHQKGHSTHGQHSVHKKDEYEKKTEFYDEFNEDGGTEKHGEHHHEHKSEKGGHEKKGHHDVADHEEKHGKKGEYEKGGHHHDHKGHKIDEGHDHHYDHHHKHGKKEGHEHGKKWSFKKGDSGGNKDGDHKKDR